MEVIMSPLQPASKVKEGCYGTASNSAQIVNGFTSENCNPNMLKDTVTLVKCTAKKSSEKSKTAALGDNDLGKFPVRRRLNCDGSAHESGTSGKSPAKAALLKEAGASPDKHFCTLLRCAANNGYAVPGSRQYLKSKRHLLAGWQPPLNSKPKTPASATRCENLGHGCNTDIHEGSEDEHVAEHNEGGVLPTELADINDVRVVDGDITPAGAPKGESHLTESKCHSRKLCQTETPKEAHGKEAHGKEAGADVKDSAESTSLQPALSVSSFKDFNKSRRGISASFPYVSLENSENSEVTQSAGTTSTRNKICEEYLLRVMNSELALLRGDALRASTNTDSDTSMHFIREDMNDSRRVACGSSRPPCRRYVKRGVRRLSSGTASNQFVLLRKQDGLKRKQAEEWMWDTAIKEAVQRLAPRVPGSVNVLVEAFESVQLTEEAVQRVKYKNTAVGRSMLKYSPFLGGCEVVEPDVSHVESIASIKKVQAWDESLASADLVSEVNFDTLRQDDENMAFTPKKLQAWIPQFSSISEPPRMLCRWRATPSDESTSTKDDTLTDEGASFVSGKSRVTGWTCAKKNQARQPHKQNLKRCTSLHPFRLRTEERGAMKDYAFSKRLHEMLEEEKRLRIPLAQGLPWTTEEPAIPQKPPAKEQTKPEGFKFITDARAIERAEFDEYVAERQKQEEFQKSEEERLRQVSAG
ncbi:hypothetical protein KC19_VG117400 [Ceratodon purpureus]|uniref:Calmodulin-binding domain-containing protein n=1 Tax=Ceratodon purpureus TaxID=3225 RepID=A0A8T0HPH5_CERPU|nr:hypothetical protein KC19_VG117400 [Ceratodon purpureus]